MPQHRSSNSGGRGGNSSSSSNNNNNNSAKKKPAGGRNVHKMGKSAAPPIPNDKADRNARNGLLLLSTNKQSTGLIASKNNATISAKTNINPSGNRDTSNSARSGRFLNHQSQSIPSTHDALLSAVNGSSHVDTEQKLDAWGVADQIKDHQSMQNKTSPVPIDGEVMFSHDKEQLESGRQYSHDVDPEYERESREQFESAASWDEYGGRGKSTNGRKGELVVTDEQESYMSQRARERAQIKAKEEEARTAEQKARAAQRLRDLERKKASNGGNGESTTRKLWVPDDEKKKNPKSNKNGKETRSSGSKSARVSDEQDSEDVIHLASYEDRDRGEQRNMAAAPRMLFDPKSGSMVEVKARSENNGTNKQRKDRRTKAGGNKKDHDTGGSDGLTKNGRNKQRGRKESEKKKANPKRRYPRTCGVLYKRDGKGRFRSVDECNGDQGYGSHSVPGGRISNAEAYQTWTDQSQTMYDIGAGFGNAEANTTLISGMSSEEPRLTMDWVKADEKIELVTGMDDSPTLKPTAKEFAPSEAALAAAAAVKTNVNGSTDDDEDDASSLVDGNMGYYEEQEEDDLEEGEEHDDGLGFDPLQGIDFMSSPMADSNDPEDIATVNLPSLSLDPPMYSGGTNSTEEPSTSHPLFGFGTSGTWGNGQGDQSGWGTSGVSGLFGSDVFRNGDHDTEKSQFLAASTTDSWGPAAVPGLGRLPTMNAADHAND